MMRRIIFMCNALDDVTRRKRGISTDSPAASKKIILLCKALRLNGVRTIILSMGRGGGISGWRNFSGGVHRVNGVPIIYMPFTTIPLISQFLSSLSLIGAIFKLRLRLFTHLIYYNRTVAFLPSLLISAVLRYRNILDLEDGEVSEKRGVRTAARIRIVSRLFDRFCSKVLLSCSALKVVTSIRPLFCYYGTISTLPITPRFKYKNLMFLMSGTLCHGTGADLLIDAIRILRQSDESWLRNVKFEITGKGESLDQFNLLASEVAHPNLLVHGRLSDVDYLRVLNRADVGLSLKLNNGPFAETTFPSKVIEYASNGLLVLTTDISDVRKVLGNGAIYLKLDEPSDLIKLIKAIALDPGGALDHSILGCNAVKNICWPKTSGERLSEFIFGSVSS